MALCPKCSSAVLSVNLREVPINAIGHQWVGVCYSCPSCATVLGVSIDPIALKSDIVDEILTTLGRR